MLFLALIVVSEALRKRGESAALSIVRVYLPSAD